MNICDAVTVGSRRVCALAGCYGRLRVPNNSVLIFPRSVTFVTNCTLRLTLLVITMKLLLSIAIVLVETVLLCLPGYAQDLPRWNNILEPYTEPAEVYDSLDCYAGGFVGMNSNSHKGALTIIDNGVVCCQTKEGSGVGAHVGSVLFYPVTSWLYVSPRVGVEGRSGNLVTNEFAVSIRGQNNQLQTGTAQREMNIQMTTLNTDFVLCIAFVRRPLVYVGGGVSVGVPLGTDFTLNENIISPSGLTYYPTGEKTAELNNGSVGNAQLPILGLRSVAGIAFSVGKGISVNPELGYHIPLTTNTTLTSENWTTAMAMARVGILWRWQR